MTDTLRGKEEGREKGGKNYSENFFWILSQKKNKQTKTFYISLLPKTEETDNLKLIQTIIEREKKESSPTQFMRLERF